MDVTHARTLIAIVETGSFKGAAEKLNVTQSAISARVRALEDVLGRRLLERSKAGVELTPAGSQFFRHASALVRIWTQAQLEVAVAEADRAHVTIGGQISLWDGFLLALVSWLRNEVKGLSVTAKVGNSTELVEQILEGTVDIAAVYRATQRPGLVVEHVFDEELVLVTSSDSDPRRPEGDYVFVNWGPEFAADHALAFPDLNRTGLTLDLGVLGIGYLLETRASGYFPKRVAQPYLDDGRLRIASKARRFLYPVYVVFPEDRDGALFDPLLAQIRQIADTAG